MCVILFCCIHIDDTSYQWLPQVIEEAEAEVAKELNGDNDNTLAIVLGTLGGILGVVLIAGGGYVFYTKKYKVSTGDKYK